MNCLCCAGSGRSVAALPKPSQTAFRDLNVLELMKLRRQRRSSSRSKRNVPLEGPICIIGGRTGHREARRLATDGADPMRDELERVARRCASVSVCKDVAAECVMP